MTGSMEQIYCQYMQIGVKVKEHKISKKTISVMIMFSFILVSFSSNISSSFETQYETEDYPTIVVLENLTDIWNITWSGNSSAATPAVPIRTFCNSSGIRNTTMIINISVNSTTPVDHLNVYFFDLINTTTSYQHNATNITMWVSVIIFLGLFGLKILVQEQVNFMMGVVVYIQIQIFGGFYQKILGPIMEIQTL